MLSPYLFALVVVVVAELAVDSALSGLLCADDLYFMKEAIVGLREMFRKLKRAFVSKDLTVNLCYSKVMVVLA